MYYHYTRKTKKKSINKYRPISLLSCVSKVMERVVFKYTFNFIRDNRLLVTFRNGKLTLGNIYRPPRFNNNNTTLKKFLSELDPISSGITKDNTDVLITGDFNIDLLQINERTEIQKYFDLFVTRGLFPRITLPTRMAARNGSLIDQLFCKIKNPSQHIISCIIKTDISDHFPYFSVLDILKKKNHQPKYVHINNNDENSFREFCNDVSNKFDQISWEQDLFNDPNKNYETLEKTLLDSKCKYLAPKTVRFKKHKHKINPWITQGILNSIRYRDKLYMKLTKTDPNSQTYLCNWIYGLKRLFEMPRLNTMQDNSTKVNQTLGTHGPSLKRF